jgi:hypothetical protein
VTAEVQPLVDAQRRVLAQVVLDGPDRRNEPAGEHVLEDPRLGPPGREHALVRHRDRLQADAAAGREQPVQRPEVVRPVPLGDGLDHLDGQDRVVLPAHLAVIQQVHADLAGQAGRGDPVLSQVALLRRERDRAHGGAAGCGLDRQFAPAGADLQYPAARPHPGRVEQPVDLAPLGGREPAVARIREQCRRVGHRLVQEQREQVVRQVVVLMGVNPRAGLVRVGPGGRAGHVQSPQPLQLPRDQPVHPAAEQGQQPGQVIALPVARHVGLAESDQAASADPPVEVGGAVQQQPRRAGAAGPEGPAAGRHHPDRQPPGRHREQPSGQRRPNPPARHGRDVGPAARVDRRVAAGQRPARARRRFAAGRVPGG